MPETASVAKRTPRADAAAAPSKDAPESAAAPEKRASVVPPAAAVASAGPDPERADTLRYEPLKAGDQIREEVSLSFSAEIQGASSDVRGNGSKVALDTKLHVDMKILKSSSQNLEELEVTLTPVSLHMDLAGHSSDIKQNSPETFDVILSGQSPNIRALSGARLQKEARITLLMLLTPLVEFHNRWASSPTLHLTSGWNSQVPVTPLAFAPTPSETMRFGLLSLRYSGSDRAVASTPFELSLPLEWTSDFLTLHLACAGRAVLGDKGRPISLDLRSPITGNVGPAGAQLGLHGSAKLTATLSYP